MVAHSPDTQKVKTDYADGWRAINRLIRGEGSWSGREPDTFYLNVGAGQFVELSEVTGLDFREDGRAYSVLDLDDDGDLDLIVKFRNAPQLRLLRNDTPTSNHSIAFRLLGGETNAAGAFKTSRDAVGALIELQTARGKRVKQVEMGSGFLSQSSLVVTFGLGAERGPLRATITWPSGRQQVLTELPADHRITVSEGSAEWQAAPFQARNNDQRICAPQQPPPPAVRPTGYAMFDPVPVPPFTLQNLEGAAVTDVNLQGRPMLLNFWATWCAPCQKEMRQWKEHYAEIRAAGAEIMALSVDEPEDAAKVRQFVRERQLPFPVLQMDAETLRRYNIFYRRLFERRSDLQIPITFLLDDQSRLVKLYRGVTPINTLLEDLRALKQGAARLARTALPYPGRRFLGAFGRDFYHLGAAFYENGLLDDARRYLEEAVAVNPGDAESWDSLGVIHGNQGQLERARAAFERAVSVRDDYASGYFNLGIAYLRLNQPGKAENAFARAAELDPNDPQKKLQYGMMLAANGNSAAAIPVLESYTKLEPADAEAHNELGALYGQTGDLARALERFRRATELKPDFADAYRNLGIAYLQQGMAFPAATALEQAVALSPDDASAYLALADAYLQSNRRREAEQTLERALELNPDHPDVQRLLERLRQPPGS